MFVIERFIKGPPYARLVPVVLLLVVSAGVYALYQRGKAAPFAGKEDSLEIVATADEDHVTKTWKVSGRLVQGGTAKGADIKRTVVWVVAKTDSGSHASYLSAAPNDQGEFEVSSIPCKIRHDMVVQLSVVARTSTGARIEKLVLDEKFRTMKGYLGVAAGIVVFVASLFVPFWGNVYLVVSSTSQRLYWRAYSRQRCSSASGWG